MQVEGIRVRQHVNPLKRELQLPLPPQDWAAIYSDVTLPLVVDVGCGSGRFLMALSHNFKQHNLLGLDIRKPVLLRRTLYDLQNVALAWFTHFCAGFPSKLGSVRQVWAALLILFLPAADRARKLVGTAAGPEQARALPHGQCHS